MKKKFLAGLLCLLMIFTMVPGVFAETTEHNHTAESMLPPSFTGSMISACPLCSYDSAIYFTSNGAVVFYCPVCKGSDAFNPDHNHGTYPFYGCICGDDCNCIVRCSCGRANLCGAKCMTCGDRKTCDYTCPNCSFDFTPCICGEDCKCIVKCECGRYGYCGNICGYCLRFISCDKDCETCSAPVDSCACGKSCFCTVTCADCKATVRCGSECGCGKKPICGADCKNCGWFGYPSFGGCFCGFNCDCIVKCVCGKYDYCGSKCTNCSRYVFCEKNCTTCDKFAFYNCVCGKNCSCTVTCSNCEAIVLCGTRCECNNKVVSCGKSCKTCVAVNEPSCECGFYYCNCVVRCDCGKVTTCGSTCTKCLTKVTCPTDCGTCKNHIPVIPSWPSYPNWPDCYCGYNCDCVVLCDYCGSVGFCGESCGMCGKTNFCRANCTTCSGWNGWYSCLCGKDCACLVDCTYCKKEDAGFCGEYCRTCGVHLSCPMGCTSCTDFVGNYRVAITAGIGGTYEITNGIYGTKGETKTLTVKAYPGYVISDVSVDGKSLGAVSSVELTMNSNHFVKLTFSRLSFVVKHTVTTNVIGGGKIVATNNGKVIDNVASVTAVHSDVLHLSFIPEKGYFIKDVKVNGKSQGALSAYTVRDIKADVTVEVEFGWICPYIDVEDQYMEALEYVTVNEIMSSYYTYRMKNRFKGEEKASQTILIAALAEAQDLGDKLDTLNERFNWAVENELVTSDAFGKGSITLQGALEIVVKYLALLEETNNVTFTGFNKEADLKDIALALKLVTEEDFNANETLLRYDLAELSLAISKLEYTVNEAE